MLKQITVIINYILEFITYVYKVHLTTVMQGLGWRVKMKLSYCKIPVLYEVVQ